MKNFTSVSLWSDGGNHFRSREYIAGVFEELYFRLKKEVKLNYFAEYHGKSIVDGHFGLISQWLKEAMYYSDIKTISDLIKEFSKKDESRHKYNPKNEILPKFFFLEYKRKIRNVKEFYSFENVKYYLSFFMFENELYASYFTFFRPENYIKIDFKKEIEVDLRPTKMSHDFSKEKMNNIKTAVGSRIKSIQEKRKHFIKKLNIRNTDV